MLVARTNGRNRATPLSFSKVEFSSEEYRNEWSRRDCGAISRFFFEIFRTNVQSLIEGSKSALFAAA